MQVAVSTLRWRFCALVAALQGAQRKKAAKGMGHIQLHVTTFLTVIHPAFDSFLRDRKQHARHQTGLYRYHISP